CIWNVHLWFRLVGQAFKMYVANDSYDRSPFSIVEAYPVSHWNLGAPEHPRHGLIHSHNQRPVLHVPGLETPSAQDGNAHCFEIAGTDGPVIGDIEVAGLLGRAAFDIERPGIVDTAKRQISRESSRLHAGYIAYALQQLALKRGDRAMLARSKFVPVGVLRWERNPSGENVLGLESRRNPHKHPKAPGHQARSGQENKSASDLADYQQTA